MTFGDRRRTSVRIECPKCEGTGKASIARCQLCDGNGKGPFYHSAIRIHDSPATIRNVTKWMQDFAFWLRLDNLQELESFYRTKGKVNAELLQEKIQDYFVNELQKNRRLSYRTQVTALTALKSCYERVRELRGVIDWRVIKEDYIRHPSGMGKVKIRGYTHTEIEKLFDNSSLQYKALIALLASTGMRLGGIYEGMDKRHRIEYPEKIHYLKFKDLKPATEDFTKDQLDYVKRSIPNYQETYRIAVYAGQVDAKTGKEHEYITYCSPEAHDLIIKMQEQRERDGEVITGESPVFRSEYNPKPTRGGWHFRSTKVTAQERERRRIHNLKNPQPLVEHAIQSYIMFRRERYLGYVITNGLTPGKARKDGPQAVHGIRGFHETTMSVNGVDKHVMEWLQGREVESMAQVYDKWPPEEILRQYWKAVGALTLDQTKYLELMIEQKDQEIKDLKLDERKRKEFEYNIHYISNQAIDNSVRNEQSLEFLKTMFLSILTPEQKEAMIRQFPQMKGMLSQQNITTMPGGDSSLPIEHKKRIIIENKDDKVQPTIEGNSRSDNTNN